MGQVREVVTVINAEYKLKIPKGTKIYDTIYNSADWDDILNSIPEMWTVEDVNPCTTEIHHELTLSYREGYAPESDIDKLINHLNKPSE